MEEDLALIEETLENYLNGKQFIFDKLKVAFWKLWNNMNY
jgi:hypothetical protein